MTANFSSSPAKKNLAGLRTQKASSILLLFVFFKFQVPTHTYTHTQKKIHFHSRCSRMLEVYGGVAMFLNSFNNSICSHYLIAFYLSVGPLQAKV
jgi:hypothetical protein